MESVRRFGQLRPICVREKHTEKMPFHEVIDGHRLVKVFKELGLEKIWAVVINPCDDLEAVRMMLVLNESRATLDHVGLAKLFKHALSRFGSDELASIIDFTPEQIEGYRDLLEFDLESFAMRGKENSQVSLGFETGDEELLR